MFVAGGRTVETCAAVLTLACAVDGNSSQAEAVKDYGKPGEAIELAIGYQPYYPNPGPD